MNCGCGFWQILWVVHCQNHKTLALIIHLVTHSLYTHSLYYIYILYIYLLLIHGPIGRPIENEYFNHLSIQVTPKYLYFFHSNDKQQQKKVLTPFHFHRRKIKTAPTRVSWVILLVLFERKTSPHIRMWSLSPHALMKHLRYVWTRFGMIDELDMHWADHRRLLRKACDRNMFYFLIFPPIPLLRVVSQHAPERDFTFGCHHFSSYLKFIKEKLQFRFFITNILK